MPDPATIIATVIPIAGAAIQSSKALFELVDDLRGGPEEIQSISTDAHSFYSIINSLKALLEDASIGEVIGGDDNMLNMIRNLTNPLSNCEAVLAKLTIKIQKHSRLDSDSRGDRMSVRVRWCLLTKKEVRDLQLRLGAAKSTLNSALNVISVYAVLPGFRRVNNTDEPKALWLALVSHGQNYYSSIGRFIQ